MNGTLATPGRLALGLAFLLAVGCSSSSSSADDAGAGGDTATSGDTAGGGDTLVPTDGAPSDGTPSDGTSGDGGTSRTLTFTNRCKTTIWVGMLNNPGEILPESGGFELDPGMRHDVVVPGKWAGRAWGRTGCVVGSDTLTCETGDCGAKAMCAGAGGKPPASLAEFTFSGFGGMDFYDVSLVDGYNLPMAIAPKIGTYTTTTGGTYDCGVPSCTSDLNVTCPTELQVKNAAGAVVACQSACEKFGTDQYCCKGAFSTSATCPPTDYSKTFKAACPGAYSYAYDDKTSTFTCKGRDYDVAFCP